MGKKRRSFFTLTVAIFVTISLLVMFFSLLDKANARKMASKYLVAVTDGVVNNVDSWFKEKKKMLNLISEMPETIDLFESGVDKYDNRLGLITRQYANIEEIFLADSVGNILQGALISDTIISNLTSLEIWPQFEKNNFNTYLDTYVSRSEQTGKLTCILLKGIFINNELKGFVGFTINWDKFVNKFIVPAQVGETGYLGITDTSGRNIGHHDVSLTLQELYQYPWMKKMIADKNGVQSYKFKNEDKMMAFQQSVQTGWIINASINEDELIRDTLRVRNGLLIISVTLFIVAFFIIVYLDLFKLEAVERDLLESERNFNLLFDRGTDGIFIHSIDYEGIPGNFKKVNKAFLNLFTLSSDKISNLSPASLFEEDNCCFYGGLIQCVLDSKLQIVETEMAINGIKRFVEFRLFLIETKDDKSVMGFIQDITDRITAKKKLKEDRDYLNEKVQERTKEILEANQKLREYIKEKDQIAKALAESEERYRSLIDRANDGIMLIVDGEISFVNRKVCSMLKSPERDLKGLLLNDIVVEEDRQWVMQNHEKRMKGMYAPNIIETRLKVNGDSSVDVEINAGVIAEDSKRIDFLFIRDITQRRKNEEQKRRHHEQLIQTDKLVALGTLVSGVAHEINNPNNAIMLNAPILREAWNTATPILESYKKEHGDFIISGMPYSFFKDYFDDILEDIHASSEKIKNIVEDLKNFARPDAGAFCDNVDVNAVIRSSVKLISSQLAKCTTGFSIDLAENVPDIQGNFIRLEQVMVNLLQNACHALTSREQAIKISSAFLPRENAVQVTVSDQGRGINQQNIKQIFDPFFTTKRDVGGTGLGLSVSLKIIKEHNGTITFDSVIGKGTNVIVKIPLTRSYINEFETA